MNLDTVLSTRAATRARNAARIADLAMARALLKHTTMRQHHDHAGHDDDRREPAVASSPGKRTRSEALPPRAAGVASGDDAAPRAAAVATEPGDDPMWFADGPPAGEGNISREEMQSLYYGINPPRHAEKAYQASDGAPPLHPRPTTVGKSGTIVALATTIYNRPPFGRKAKFSICGRDGRVLYHGEVATPGKVEVPGLEPGLQVLIRPETIGTMVKLLTPEQIAGAADEDHAGRVSS